LGRLNPDGTLDTAFNPNLWKTTDPAVLALEVQMDGKILVGGRFTTVGGEPRTNLVRLNLDGTVDSTFDARVDGDDFPTVYTFALQPDGKILVGGSFTALNGEPHGLFGRLNVDGTLDTTLNPEGARGGDTPAVRSLVVQPNGAILVAGEFGNLDSTSQSGIGRVSPYGELDFSANMAISGPVNCLAVTASGMIWAGGKFTGIGFAEEIPDDVLGRQNLVGYNPTPFQFTSTAVSADRDVICLALQEDGKVLVGGYFDQLNEQT